MRVVRALAGLLLTVLLASACSSEHHGGPYAALSAKIGQSQAVLGWNISVADLRFDNDRVLVDIDAAPAAAGAPHAKPESLRFGLYGALAHPVEAAAIGSCAEAASPDLAPLAATDPDHLTGTVCLGPLRDQSQVRGVYVYSPRDRIPDTAVSYAAAFPVGLAPTNENDTGLVLRTTSVDAFRADGAKLDTGALGDPTAFTGNGYLLLGLSIDGLASRYRADSVRRGGPLMVLTAPTLPGKNLSYACSVYGSSLLVLPDSSLDAVAVRASLCTQGEINAALLYPTVAVVGTHTALWTR